MSRRSGHDLNVTTARCAALVAAALGASACRSADTGDAGCEIAQQVDVPGSPLTLLPDAVLVRTGTALTLVAADAAGPTVRWASFDPVAGALGAERSMPLPVGAAPPWVTVSSAKDPGDTLLVIEAVAATKPSDAELHVVAVPTSGSVASPPALGPAVATIPNGLATGAGPSVALGASRAGPHAVVAWIAPGDSNAATMPTVQELVLSAAGEPIGAQAMLGQAPAFGCLAFVEGKSALTLGFHEYATATTRIPTFVITELADAGTVDSTLSLTLESHVANCPRVTPTAGGYALVFEDTEAAWLGVYDQAANSFPTTAFAPAVAFGGPGRLPDLVGLTPAGTDFAVAVGSSRSGELWRLAPSGTRRDGRVVMPSTKGRIGTVSTVPDTSAFTATYADYTALDQSAGQRVFLRLSCQ
jgi:hypothetical protein